MSTTLNQQNKVVSVRSTTTPPASVSPRWVRRRAISHLNMSSCGAQTGRGVFAAPRSGWCMVRPHFHTDYAGGTSTITAWAVAGGRAFANDNPLNTDGSPATWRVGGAVTLSAASATQATDGLYGVGVGQWLPVFVPPAIDRGGAGYLTFSVQPSGTNSRCIVNSTAKEYGTATSPRLPGMEYRSVIAGAGTDYTTANQGAFVSNGQSWGPDYNFIVGFDWMPMDGSAQNLVMVGDSIVDGFCENLNNTSVMSYGHSYGAYAAYLMTTCGHTVAYCNYGSMGKDAPYFHGRLAQAELDAEFIPTWIGIPGFSVNGLLTLSTIEAGLASAFARYDASEARGSKPFLITVNAPNPPGAAATETADQFANRMRGNAKIRQSGRRYFDFEAILQDKAGAPFPRLAAANTYDNTHPGLVGHTLGGEALCRFIRAI